MKLILDSDKKTCRWVLLRHIESSDDPKKIHFDLLLEDVKFCRSWRLSEIPYLNGPFVEAIYSSPHELDWLDIIEKGVSGDRGWAKRIKKGIIFDSLPVVETSSLNLSATWDDKEVILEINSNNCRVRSSKN